MRFRRRFDARFLLESQVSTACCLQDPLTNATGVAGRLVDLSRGGIGIHVQSAKAVKFEPGRDFLITAALPATGARLKRLARIMSQRDDASGGTVVSLRWIDAGAADSYAKLQQTRFEAALLELSRKSGQGRSTVAADCVSALAERNRFDVLKNCV